MTKTSLCPIAVTRKRISRWSTDLKVSFFPPSIYKSAIIYCAISGHGGGWGYSGHSVEAIRFMSDTDILLGGLSLFGGRGEYMGKIKVCLYSPLTSFIRDDEDVFTFELVCRYSISVWEVAYKKEMENFWLKRMMSSTNVERANAILYSFLSRSDCKPTGGTWLGRVLMDRLAIADLVARAPLPPKTSNLHNIQYPLV